MAKNLVEFVAQFSAKKTSSFTKAQKGVGEMQDKIQKINKSKIKPQVAKSTTTGISSLVKSLGSITLILGAFSAAKSFLGLGIQAEQVSAQYGVLLGSASKAQEKIAELQKFASETPLDPEQVLKSGKSLIAMGVDVDKVVEKQRMLGDISLATGKDFNELSDIYGKALAGGVVQADELNQITEAGIPIMGELGKVLGVGADKVKKMGSEGKISFEQLDQALQNLTGEGGKYQNMMAKMANTTAGRWTKLTGSIQMTLTALSTKFRPVLNSAIDTLTKLWEWSEKNVGILEAIAWVVGIAVTAFYAYTAAMWVSTTATTAFTVATTLLKAVMALNPITLIVMALGALAIGLTIAWNRSEKFRQVVMGVWEWIKQLGVSVWELAKQFWESSKGILSVIFPIIGIVRKLYQYWVDNKEAIIDFAKSAIEWVTKVGKSIKEWISGTIESAMKLWNKAVGIFSDSELGKKTIEVTTSVSEKLGSAYDRGVAKQKARDAAKALAEKEKQLKAQKAEDDATKAKAEYDANKKALDEGANGANGGLGGNVDNRAQGVRDETKNISINIGTLGDFNGASFSAENIKDFGDQLMRELFRVANSANTI